MSDTRKPSQDAADVARELWERHELDHFVPAPARQLVRELLSSAYLKGQVAAYRYAVGTKLGDLSDPGETV